MSLLNNLSSILNSGAVGEILQTLAGQAGAAANNVSRNAPGGLGGLLGASAMGALLSKGMPGGLGQNAALLGLGAVAWNFYQKWAANKQQANGSATSGGGMQALQQLFQNAGSELPPVNLDDTSTLMIRAMVYAAKADGNIDATERDRMNTIIQQLIPGQNVSAIIQKFAQETLDPSLIADSVASDEQGEDIYRLSCMVIDIDHFMERGYLDALANGLGIDSATKATLEQEAQYAKKQLQQAM